MGKKKIAWITPDCYIDVDLPVINKLCNSFEIQWQIIVSNGAQVDDRNYVYNGLSNRNLLTVEFIHLKHRSRSIKLIPVYLDIIKKAKSWTPDIYYISFNALPYGILLYRLLLPLKKVVIACHNVTTPKGATNEKIQSIYTNLWLKTFKNIQVFSKSQQYELEKQYTGKNVLYAPLAIKDYGNPSLVFDKNNSEVIRFLFFGNILPYKRVDILIKSAQLLYEKGVRNFKVRIAGNCKHWEMYSTLIKYNEIFELNIKRIPNEDVANLFADSHYFVMPYQDIAQSGAITVAFRYNVPTIVSDIPQFAEFVENGKTGLTFQSENVESLSFVLEQVIKDRSEYKQLCENQRLFTEQELSLDSIITRYRSYFNEI